MLDQMRALYEAREFRKAVDMYRVNELPEAEWHLYGALAGYHANTFNDFRLAGNAIAKAEQLPSSGLLRLKVRFLSAIIARERGDIFKSVEDLASLVDELETSQYKFLLYGPALYNLALAQYAAKNLDDAIATYAKAAEELDAGCRHMALQNAAWVCAESGQVERAEFFLSQTKPIGDAYTVTLAYILHVKGETDKAVELVAGYPVNDEISNDVRSLAAALCSLFLAKIGELDKAKTASTHAIMLAQKERDCRCMRFANHVAGIVYRKKEETA